MVHPGREVAVLHFLAVEFDLQAQFVHRVGVAHGVLVADLAALVQVEQSLVGKADRPAQERIDRAFGCGCPGGSACAPQYLGLEKQMRCAGKTLANRRRDSVNGVGRWIAGVPWRSLEGLKVKPKNHGTAALYAYTPWVGIENGNGNWLVWNVTRKLDSKLRELMGW